MPDLSSTFWGVEMRTWITGGATVLLAAIAHNDAGTLAHHTRGWDHFSDTFDGAHSLGFDCRRASSG